MHGASKARVERPNHPAHLDEAGRVGDRRADERFFHRPALAAVVAGRKFPGGGGDYLVMPDFAGIEFEPVAEGAAHDVGQPGAFAAERQVVGPQGGLAGDELG